MSPIIKTFERSRNHWKICDKLCLDSLYGKRHFLDNLTSFDASRYDRNIPGSVQNLLTEFNSILYPAIALRSWARYPCCISITIIVNILIFSHGASSGYLNPALNFGIAAASGVWTKHYVYWAGTALGGINAALMYGLVFASDHHLWIRQPSSYMPERIA